MRKNKTKDMYRMLFRGYPDVVTVKEVCSMLNLGEKKVYQLIKTKQLTKLPCGRINKITKASVISFVLQSAQESDKAPV